MRSNSATNGGQEGSCKEKTLMFGRIVRALIATALLMQAVGLAAIARTIWLMRHPEAFWMYHDGGWQKYAYAIAIFALAAIMLPLVRGRWFPWLGLLALGAGALFTGLPLAINLMLPYSSGLPDVSYANQRTVVELFLLGLMLYVVELCAAAAFVVLLRLFANRDAEQPIADIEQPRRARTLEVMEIVAADDSVPVLDTHSHQP